MNEKQVAESLNVSVKLLQKQRMTGEGLPYLKIGKCVRYDPQDVEQFIINSKVKSTSEKAE